MYYQRLDVKRAITNFANVGGSFRECAFYNNRAKSIQRYFDEGELRRPVVLDNPAEVTHAVAAGASAFYCSYWMYQKQDISRPAGRDLVWVARAKQGGLNFAKAATVWVLEALENAGVPEPWVKYSGDLGFDLVMPLETTLCGSWASSMVGLSDLQGELTNYIVGYLRERVPGITVVDDTPSIQIKKGTKTCLLSELRVRRGLLLAPMSLCPETGFVSVPLNPREVGKFSVLDASSKNARAYVWGQPSGTTHELLKYIRGWQSSQIQTKLATA